AFYNCSALVNVVIPDSVTNIGNSAFYNCSALVNVVIPDSVTNIGNSAFRSCVGTAELKIGNGVTNIGSNAFNNCSGIATLDLGESVTNIGVNAFYGCVSLVDVTIPDSTTAIGNGAFYGCTSLANLYLGDELAKIGEQAFYNCTSLKAVVIPASITSIGNNAFFNCYSVQSYTVDIDNVAYASDSYGVLLNKEMSTLLNYPAGNTRKEYKFPETVTNIGSYAFYKASYLKVIDAMSSELAVIADYGAFYECTSLTDVYFPKTLSSVGYEAFYNSSSNMTAHYKGSEEEWENVSISSHNTRLISAPKCYNCPHPGVNPVNEFTVSYSYVGEIPAGVPALPADATYKINDVVTVAAKPALTGYTFDGWYYNGAKVESFTMPSANVNLTGKWVKEVVPEYTLTFDANGGVFADGTTKKTVKYTYGASIDNYFEAPAREGYVFVRWDIIPATMPDHDITVKAEWERIPEPEEVAYTVTILEENVDGETYSLVETYARTAPEGTTVSVTPEEKTGFTVDVEASNLSEVLVIGYMTDLCVVYDRNEYTLTVDANGGKFADGTSKKTVKYLYDATVSTPETPSKEGYDFVSWSNAVPSKMPANNVTVNAVWEAVETPGCGHAETTVVTIPATCKVAGMKYSVCVECGETVGVPEVLPVIPHTIVTVVSVEPTCTREGREYDKCSACGDRIGAERTIAKLPHTPGAWETVTEPTCTTEGEKVQKCTVCGLIIDTETIPVKPHTPGAWVTETEPTCTSEGKKVKKCTVCSEILDTITLDPLPHTPGEWVTVTEPTGTSEGKKVQKCTVCGTVLAEQIIPKNEVLKDDETGIEIEYPDGSQGDNVAIVVEESFDGSAFNLIDTKTDATQSFIYDIKMTVNGYETQPQGAVT
ncbi:MAG: leucine-rich repeat protein, partial [Clostridia bacterium]|nr:leucine-rich repeat protein [Clostridia bacterium]